MDVLAGPCVIFGKVIKKLSCLVKVIGLNVLHPDYTANNKCLKFTIFSMIIYIFATLHTFNVAEDFVATVFCLATFGNYSQVSGSGINYSGNELIEFPGRDEDLRFPLPPPEDSATLQ